jgi:hypothetical protein
MGTLRLVINNLLNTMNIKNLTDLARDLRELLIIAHRVPNETDRRKLADIAEKWLRKLPIETN